MKALLATTRVLAPVMPGIALLGPALLGFLTLAPTARTQDGRFSELRDEYSAARTRSGDAASVTEQFLPRFQTAAEETRDPVSAAPFLVWILQNAGLHHEAAKDALEELLRGGPDRALATVAGHLPYLHAVLGPEVVSDALEQLITSEDVEVQANALYSRALILTTEWGRRSEEIQRERIAQELEWVRQNTGDAALRARAATLDLVSRGLGVGDRAPEILGLDLQGKPFKLSDYRGKVVVLDFWGDW